MSLKSFPGTEKGAAALLAEFVKPGADTMGLSKQLRPSLADYKALFDGPTATKIESVYSPEWEAENLVIAPKPGQTEVKLWRATVAELRAGTGHAKEFPGAYKQIIPHFVGNAAIYRFKFVEPGKDTGMSFDGLAHVNGHWVIVPKPWRGLDDHH
ncbi:MAG: hypothetical protein KF819_02010 [Labilithrix sp.]|nr:hypothetical protein [Labilithrix sp.]